MLSVIGFNDLWSVNLVSWFPGVVRFRIPFPFNEILESSSLASIPMIDHFLDFVFFFTFDKVRRWPGVVRSMRVSFADRKSTRLNSSHTVISYAVFCLNKKILHV